MTTPSIPPRRYTDALEHKLWLKALEAAAYHQRLVDHHRTKRDEAVHVLRSPGLDGQVLATWAEVGQVLGITRQAAQLRYKHLSWSMDNDIEQADGRA